MPKDAAQAALDILRADSTVTSLVTGGANNILDSGDMRMQELADAEEERRSISGTGVLGVSVQDGGEVQQRDQLTRQTVIVRALDRLNGFEAIRSVRFAIVKTLKHKSAAFDDNQGAVVNFRYQARTGHRVDRTYGVHFEAITFVATVQYTED